VPLSAPVPGAVTMPAFRIRVWQAGVPGGPWPAGPTGIPRRATSKVGHGSHVNILPVPKVVQ
jgi:hypothetical protein